MEPIEVHRVRFLRRHDGVLPVLVHRRFRRRHHARSHLHRLGAQGQGRGHGGTVGEAASGDDGQISAGPHQGEKHQGGDVLRILKPPALRALHHQAVDAGVDGLQGRVQGRNHVEDR